MNRIFASAFALLTLCAPALAHQPVMNNDAGATASSPYDIDEPEISKAIFAELKGAPQYYRIKSDKPFAFYAGITVPKIDNCPLTQRFSFEVLDSEMQPVTTADGESFAWWPWYESFGKKWYWVGPEIGRDFKSTQRFAAGTYTIRVFNADNRGRYVLAVGDVESFPADVIVRTLVTLPGINRDFWDNVTCGTK